MTPQQLATFNSEIASGQNMGTANSMYGAGTNYLNMGQNESQGALTGLNAFNPSNYYGMPQAIAGGNAYAAGENIPAQVQAAMTSANQEANEVQLPGMASAAQVAGNGANNSRSALAQGVVQQGLAENAQGLSAQLQGQAYNTGAGLATSAGETAAGQALSGLGTQAQYGGAYGTLGLGGLSEGLQQQTGLYNMQSAGGSGLQQANQLPMTNQQQAYQFGQTSPYEGLQGEYGIVGSNQWGGTSNTNSSTQYTPSLLSELGAGAGVLGSLFGGSGTSGGALGGLSSLFNGGVGGGSYVNGVSVAPGSIQYNPIQAAILSGSMYP